MMSAKLPARHSTQPLQPAPRRAPERPPGEGRSLIAPEVISNILKYEAPYLIDKLLKEHIVSSAEEATGLFVEAKKYMIMCRVDRSINWSMSSLRVDEVWHQFVLFTERYMAFCQEFFGSYVQHAPGNAPHPPGWPVKQTASRAEFDAFYGRLFGEPVSDLWRDDLSVHVDRRLVNHHLGNLETRTEGGRAELVGRDEGAVTDDRVLLRVDAWALDALRFIAGKGRFFVRELPSPMDDSERVDLCTALVRSRVLRVAP